MVLSSMILLDFFQQVMMNSTTGVPKVSFVN